MVCPSETCQWRIQTVPVEPGSFEGRRPGLSYKELQDVSGIDDAMFCHNGLFIADAKSFENGINRTSRLNFT